MAIAIIDSLEHDTAYGQYPAICKIDDTHLFVAYCGSGTDGYVKTFSVDSNKDTITEIDSIEHDTTAGNFHSCALLDSTHVVVAYLRDSSHYLVKIFSINGSYEITEVTSYDIGATNYRQSSLCIIDSTHFILATTYAYLGTYRMYLYTISVDGSYNLTVEASTYVTTPLQESRSCALIDSTHFATCYSGSSSDGYIAIFTFDENYENITAVNTLEYDTSYGSFASVIKLVSGYLAVAHRGTSDDGFVRIISYDGSYNLAAVSVLEHDTASGFEPRICKLDDTNFFVAYDNNTDAKTYAKTFSVDGSYNITQDAVLEIGVINTTYTGAPAIVAIGSAYVALAYNETGNDAWLVTLSTGVGGATQYTKELTANITITASRILQTGKTLTANATATSSMSRAMIWVKSLIANITAAASMVRGRAFIKLLVANITATASNVKQTGKNLTANITATATMTRVMAWVKVLTASVTATGSAVKSIGKFLTANVTVAGSLTAIKVILKTLIANVTVAASMARSTTFSKILTASAKATSSFVRSTGKNLTAQITATPAMVKQTSKTLTANIAATASFTAMKVIMKELIANITVAASQVKQTAKNLNASVTASGGMVKVIAKNLTASISAAASFLAGRYFTKELIATITAAASMVKSAGKVMTANVTASSTMLKAISKSLVANIKITATNVAGYVSVSWNKVLNKFRLKHYSLRHYDD